MPVTDSISDFLTRIRNAGAAGHKTVDIPSSKLKEAIAAILKEQGFIEDYEVLPDRIQNKLKVTIRYFKRKPAIKKLSRVSKPGRRVYASVDNLPRVKNGLGIAIISTSKGVMSDKTARSMKVGGEVLCSVW